MFLLNTVMAHFLFDGLIWAFTVDTGVYSGFEDYPVIVLLWIIYSV